MTIHIPKPGDRVRVSEVFHDSGRQDALGKVYTVGKAWPETGQHTGWIMLVTDNPISAVICRVSPLPASELEVECPHDGCEGKPGARCTTCCECLTAYDRTPSPFHSERRALFLSLTGQAPKDSGPTSTSRARGVGSERGDSGTGRAAACSAPGDRTPAEPAAPSGFPKCRTPKCRQEPRRAGYCADCAGDIDPRDDFQDPKRRRAIELLHHDLDRPLPKVVAAERIWPEAWATPGWESK